MRLLASFNGTDKMMVAGLTSKADNLIKRLTLKVNALMIRLQAKIQGEKLEGQVLHHRTGKLSQSIRAIPARMDGARIVGEVQGGGGVAWYGQLHETGGTFEVPAHTRRVGCNARGEVVRLLTRASRTRKNVDHIEEVEVRAHTITFPQRSFMRSSEAEMHDTIVAEIQEEARDALA